MKIPELRLDMQATELVSPITRWGSIGRSLPMVGTYHHYSDDYKLMGIWKKPDRLPDSGCKVAVEVNYSTWENMYRDRLIEGIYRKRWLARRWQDRGVRIVVDLNVDPAFRDMALLGVPHGWRAYAVRHQAGIGPETIEADWRAAIERAGTSEILFCVFGGWRRVRDLCAERNWVWVPESLHAARGSTDGTRRWK